MQVVQTTVLFENALSSRIVNTEERSLMIYSQGHISNSQGET